MIYDLLEKRFDLFAYSRRYEGVFGFVYLISRERICVCIVRHSKLSRAPTISSEELLMASEVFKIELHRVNVKNLLIVIGLVTDLLCATTTQFVCS